jgi:hypothetical protein
MAGMAGGMMGGGMQGQQGMQQQQQPQGGGLGGMLGGMAGMAGGMMGGQQQQQRDQFGNPIQGAAGMLGGMMGGMQGQQGMQQRDQFGNPIQGAAGMLGGMFGGGQQQQPQRDQFGNPIPGVAGMAGQMAGMAGGAAGMLGGMFGGGQQQPQRDQFGNPIPGAAGMAGQMAGMAGGAAGMLGGMFGGAPKPQQFDQFGRPIPAPAAGLGGMLGGLMGGPKPPQQYDQFGRPIPPTPGLSPGAVAGAASLAAGALGGLGSLFGKKKTSTPAAVAKPVTPPTPAAPVTAPVAATSAIPAAASKPAGAGKPVVSGGDEPKVDVAAVVAQFTTDFGPNMAKELSKASNDFSVDALSLKFVAGGKDYKVTFNFGFTGFGDPKKPFEAVPGVLGDMASPELKQELAAMLKLNPAEVFVIKLVMLLNQTKSSAGQDLDAEDVILLNLPFLLYRLEQTAAYSKSSQPAFNAVREHLKSLLNLVEFPRNYWYEQAVTSMPGGKPSEFMQSISKMRWAVGHKARTKMLAEKILPNVTSSLTELEKAYFVYAVKAHLQEYEGGFVSSEKPAFMKTVIDARLDALKPVLQKAVAAMRTAKISAGDIAKTSDFLTKIDTLPRVAADDLEPLVQLVIPTDQGAQDIKGVAYYVKYIDRFMREHILHRIEPGEPEYVFFDFGYGHRLSFEAIMALNMSLLRKDGDMATLIKDGLADIYFRGISVMIDAQLGSLGTIDGSFGSKMQAARGQAKKDGADKSESLDDAVMDREDMASGPSPVDSTDAVDAVPVPVPAAPEAAPKVPVVVSPSQLAKVPVTKPLAKPPVVLPGPAAARPAGAKKAAAAA